MAAYLIPQCLAYGELAGVEPVRGLWAVLPALLLYAWLGSSPQLSVGPESTTAVMTAAAIAPLAAGDGRAYGELASLLALLVGGLCFLAAACRLGFLAELFSRPVLVGYLAGVALLMIRGQLGALAGGDGAIHGPTLVLGLGVLAFLLLLQWRVPRAPGPLLAMLLAVAVVAVAGLEARGVAVLGALPTGLPRLGLPQPLPAQGMTAETWRSLLGAALGIALVGFSDNVLTARAFAARGGYRIDAQRELLALGAVNVGCGLVQGFPVSSSGSRTALGDALGSRCQRFSLVALAVVLLALWSLRPLLALFPRAALAAVVIYAALRLIDVGEFQRMRRFKRSEFRLALLTLAGVLLTDILTGVALAVAFSVLDLFARLMRPNDAVMGQVPRLAGLHDVSDWEGATTIPGLLIYRYDAPLCFANAEHFRSRALAALEAETSAVRWFVLNAEAIVEIDITAADVLGELQNELRKRGICFALARVKQDLVQQLRRAGLVEAIGEEHLFPTLNTAIAAFRTWEARAEPH